jgi:hypothetical protein
MLQGVLHKSSRLTVVKGEVAEAGKSNRAGICRVGASSRGWDANLAA